MTLVAVNYDPFAPQEETEPGLIPVDFDPFAERRSATFGESFGRGVDQAQGMLYGAVEATGEAFGSETLTEFGREGRVRNEQEAAQYPERQSFTGIRGIGDAAQWAKDTIAEQVPMMAPGIAGGITGAAAGTAIAGPVGTVIGGLIGAFVPSMAMGVGEVQGNIKQKDPDAVAPGIAFLGGSAIAALDSVLPGKVGTALARKFGAEAAEEIAKRALTKRVAGGMLTEGGTEAVQEAIGEAAAAYATGQEWDENWAWNSLEAGAAGALMGGVVGGVSPSGARGPAKPAEEPAPAAAPERPRAPLTPADEASPIQNDLLSQGYAEAGLREPIGGRPAADAQNPAQNSETPKSVSGAEWEPLFDEDGNQIGWNNKRGGLPLMARDGPLEEQLARQAQAPAPQPAPEASSFFEGTQRVLESIPQVVAQEPVAAPAAPAVEASAATPATALAEPAPALGSQPQLSEAPASSAADSAPDFDTSLRATRLTSNPAAKAEDGRAYRIKQDGEGFIALQMPNKKGMPVRYLRPEKGEVWSEEQAVARVQQEISSSVAPAEGKIREDISSIISLDRAPAAPTHTPEPAQNPTLLKKDGKPFRTKQEAALKIPKKARSMYEQVKVKGGWGNRLIAGDFEVKQRARRQPRDILEFIAANGGLKLTDEMKARDWHKRSYIVPGFGPLVRKDGQDHDRIREMAAEAGYLGGDIEFALANTTPDDVYGRVDQVIAERRAKKAGQMPESDATPVGQAAPAPEARATAEANLAAYYESQGYSEALVEPDVHESAIQRIMGGFTPAAALDDAQAEIASREIRDGLEGGASEDSGDVPFFGSEGRDAGASEAPAQPGRDVRDDRQEQGFDYEPGAEGLDQAVVPGSREDTTAGEARAAQDRATEEARVRSQQGMIRRGGQRRVEDEKGGLFEEKPAERDIFDDGPKHARAPGFYSAVLKAVENAKQPKGSPAQWLGILRNTQGVKPEEMEWLGLEEWLNKHARPVTKEEIAEFIRANQIAVEEVVKGEGTHADLFEVTEANVEPAIAYLRDNVSGSDPRVSWGYGDDLDYIRLANETERTQRPVAGRGATKFGSYTLPGGENYRELLLTLPAASRGQGEAVVEFNKAMRAKYGEHWVARMTPEEDRQHDALIEAQARAEEGRIYKSSHWDEPNIVAHVRFNERTIDGKRTLFIEEIQSDWHQAGRKRGYRNPAGQDTTASAQADLLEFEGRMAERYDFRWMSEMTPAEQAEHRRLADAWERAQRASGPDSVPDAPFKTTWQELALKRAIRWAVDNGFDQVAWTTGETQNARYDLSKTISKISLVESSGGIGAVESDKPFTGGMLYAYDKDHREVLKRYVTSEADIADMIGKEAAEKLVKAEPRHGRNGDGGYRGRYLEGQELQIGGSGMRGFYDKILVDAANKLGKRFGAQVQRFGGKVADGAKVFNLYNEFGGLVRSYNSEPEAVQAWSEAPRQGWEVREEVDQASSKPIHVLPLTQALKESAASEGFPLFRRGATDPASFGADVETREFRTGTERTITSGRSEDLTERLASAIRPHLEKLGLPDISVRMVEAIDFITREGGRHTAQANYFEGLVSIALNATDDNWNLLHHEILHALKDMGLFTKSEWAILEARAKREWDKRYNVAKDYPDLDAAAQNEEGIASAFGDHMMGGLKVDGTVARIFEKIKKFFEALRNALNGLGFRTAEDVFAAIESGEVGRRERNEGGFADTPRHSRTAAVADFGQPREGVLQALRNDNRTLLQNLKAATSWDAISASIDAWRWAFQDNVIDLKNIERALGRLGSAGSAYTHYELADRRTGARLEKLHEQMVVPLAKAIHDLGDKSVTAAGETYKGVDIVEAYLYAKHAGERNARIASINEQIPEGGSGMSDADAAAIIAAVERAGLTADLEAIAAKVKEFNEFSLRTRVEAGLLTQEQADAWRAQYQHYVPLRGHAELDPEVDSGARPSFGSGITTRGAESRRALGRTTRAAEILSHVIMQAQEAVIRAENNAVGQALGTLATENPNEGFWSVDQVEVRATWSKAKQQVVYMPVRNLSKADEAVTVFYKVDGKEHRVTFNRENPQARRLAEALRNQHGKDFGLIVRTFGAINRFLSMMNTTLNPEFVITNAMRDIQTGMINVRSLDVDGIAKKVGKLYLPALKASWRANFHQDKSGEWGQWYERFAMAGGETHWNQVSDVAEIRAKLDRELRRAGRSSSDIRRRARNIKDGIENANKGVENALRLAAFRAAVESGLTDRQAASIATNVTVNFNRKGVYGSAVNSLYLFYNAGVQGTFTMLSAMRSRRVQKIVGGIVTFGAVNGIINSLASDEDEDGEKFYDKIPRHVKERNIVVMLGGDKYIPIPMPYGYSAFHTLGRATADAFFKKGPAKERAMEAAWDVTLSLLNSFNPIGGSDHILNVILPTIFDPVSDLVRNRDFRDAPIMPDEKQFGPDVPDAQRYWASVSPGAKLATDFISSLTGGDKVRPGLVDVSPESLEYLWGVATGAAGTFMRRAVELPFKALDPAKDLEWNDIPIARKFVGDKPGYVDRDAFYRRHGEIEQQKDYIKRYIADGQPEMARQVREEQKHILRLEPLGDAVRKQLGEIRKQRAHLLDAKQKGRMDADAYNARIKTLKEREEAVIDRFNKAWVAAVNGDR